LDVIPSADGVTVRRVWLSWRTAPLALFAIVWDSFLFFWYQQALANPNRPLMTVLFPLGHVAVGIGITYYVLASLVNKTDVTVSSSGVTVATGPAPWIGNKVVKANEITDVIVRERNGNRNNRTYNVMFADRVHKEKKLVTWLAESDQAEFIAQVIKHSLAIAPRA
jgi:hypothetical protein